MYSEHNLLQVLASESQRSADADLNLKLKPTLQPMSTPVFSGGIYCAEDFAHALEATYSEIVHWRINSFKVPAGKAGKEFVHGLFRLFLAFASASSMESIALRAAMVKREGTCRLS